MSRASIGVGADPVALLHEAATTLTAAEHRLLILGAPVVDLASYGIAATQTVPLTSDGTPATHHEREESWPAIFCWTPSAHTHAFEGFLAEAQRLLTPGGLFLALERRGPNAHRLEKLLPHYLEPVETRPASEDWILLSARRRPRHEIAGHFEALAEGYWDELPSHIQELYFRRKVAFLRKHLPTSGRALAGLDLGCGVGQFTRAVSEGVGARVVGVDAARASLQQARRNAPRNDAHFAAANGLRLPFPDATFDFAYAVNVLHHLKRGEQERALAEVHRVLKKGAPFFLLEMNVRNRLLHWYLRKIYPKTRRIDRGDEEFIHPARLPLSPLFHLEGIEYSTFVPDFVPAWALPAARGVERLLEATPLRRYGVHYAAVLRAVSST